jgi:ketosteroid isomerase-like protein
MTDDEGKIRAARAELNRAIIDRNTAIYAQYWVDDAQITAGSGESLGNNRAKHVKRFVSTFADPAFIGGERNTTSIEINEADGLAAEHGQWSWRYQRDNERQDSQGTYLVMWRKVRGDWRIQSELYVMLRCTISEDQ